MSSNSAPVVNRLRIIPRTDDFLDRNVGSSGEIFFNNNSSSLRVYDGNNRGGFELARADLSNVDTTTFALADLSNTDLTGYATVESLILYAQNDLSNVTNEDFLSKAESSGFSGGASVDVGINPPAEPEQGNIWLNSNNGKLFVYINDGDSDQWVQPNTPIPNTFSTIEISDSTQIAASGIDTFSINEGNNIQISADPETNTITISSLSGFSGNYADLINKPVLSTVATSGSYADLLNQPTAFSQITISASAPNNALEIVNESDDSVTASFAANGTLSLPSFIASGDSFISRTYESVEVIDSASSAVTFNATANDNSSVFYLTNPAGNFVANFSNIDITGDPKTVSYAVIISQGTTPYMPSSVQVNGSNATVKWQGGTGIPAGTANQLDIISFTMLINSGSVAEVFASATTYA